MTQHSLLFHIVRGALVGFAGGLALGLALIFVMTSLASAQTSSGQTHESVAKLLQERCAERPVVAALKTRGRPAW